MTRVLIVQFNSKSAEPFSALLANQAHLQLVGMVADLSQALAHLQNCDVVLVSDQFSASQVRGLLRAMVVPCRVIVVGKMQAPAQIVSYLEAGATGYIAEPNHAAQLVEHIQAAERGELVISPAVALELVERMRQLRALSRQKQFDAEIEPNSNAQLTARERMVLSLIGQGLTNQEIAKSLTIEPGTVKNHVHSILKKLNLTSRAQAARYYALMASASAKAPADLNDSLTPQVFN